jgi:protein-disulfide isomerase
MNSTEQNQQMVPISIIIAGLIIAAAIYFGGGSGGAGNVNLAGSNNPAAAAAVGTVAPVTDKDHILGSKDAEIVVVEYSDFDCPFCRSFHNTMHQVVNDYGGRVAWVYRQFPINSLHPNAVKKAEASECVAELGGNLAFWKFADAMFANSYTLADLPKVVGDIGVSASAWSTCYNAGKYTAQIQADVAAATKAGAQGTPYSVILTKNGKKEAINGALPIERVKSQIDALLK